MFNRSYWKKGYAAEALRALMRNLFAHGTHRIFAMCDPQNPNSWKLLERVGMRREGTQLQNVYFFRDAAGNPLWKDTYQYAILASEFAAAKK